MMPYSDMVSGVTLLSCIAAIEAAWINVTLSSQNIQNGTSVRFTAASNPIIGGNFFDNLDCEYTEQDGTGPTLLAEYNRYASLPKMVIPASASATVRARLNLTSSVNPMELDIYPITFGDEKRLFYCTLKYAESGSVRTIVSDKHQLQNVYSPHVLNEAQSMQSTTSMLEGIAANLTCVATGRPASNITWLYNSNINATNVVTYEGSPLITVTSVLTIHNPTHSLDGQQNTCVISNQFSSTIYKTTILDVNFRPINTTLTIYPENPHINQAFTLHCNSIGKPPVTIYRFYKDGILMGTIKSGNLSVTIATCSKTNHLFTCVPENAMGQGKTVQKLVMATVDVWTSVPSVSRILIKGESATLQCTAYGCPIPSVSWVKDGQRLNVSGNSLVLNSLRISDAGQYVCHAQNSNTSSSSEVKVIVNYAPEQVGLKVSSVFPRNGTSLTLHCSARAAPLPSRYKFTSIRDSSETILQDTSSSTHVIAVIDYKNYENYKATFACVPFNSVGSGPSKNVTVDIQVSPKISTALSITVAEGDSITLYCNIIAANPPPTITWLNPANLTMPHTNGGIQLQSINRNQHGVYICQASNGVGMIARKTTALTVNYGPSILQRSTIVELCIGESAQIVCSASGQPLPDVSLYLNGAYLSWNSSSLVYITQIDAAAKFGRYICASNNTVGIVNVTKTLKAKSPGAVGNITLTAKGNTISVSWDLPQCSSNIDSIRVQYKKKAQINWGWEIQTKTASDDTITLTGLETGAEYEVRVIVVDINGQQHAMKAAGTAKPTKPEPTTNSNASSAAEVALYTVIPMLMVVIAALLVLILRLRKQVTSLSKKMDMLPKENRQGAYTDLQPNNMNLEAQQYASITNPGAVAYEQIPEANSSYMELNNHREVEQKYSKLSKDYEELGM